MSAGGFAAKKTRGQYGEEDLVALSLIVTLCGAGFCLADAGEYLRLERAAKRRAPRGCACWTAAGAGT